MSYRAIFVNGIQSSGKSSTVAELVRRESAFQIVEGDEIIRRVPTVRERLRRYEQLFLRTLDVIEERLVAGDMIFDGAWSGRQIQTAQDRFDGLFVILRIDEQERRRREAKRRDRQLVHWQPDFHEMPGPDDLYDLVIDANSASPAECADRVLAEAHERWPDRR